MLRRRRKIARKRQSGRRVGWGTVSKRGIKKSVKNGRRIKISRRPAARKLRVFNRNRRPVVRPRVKRVRKASVSRSFGGSKARQPTPAARRRTRQLRYKKKKAPIRRVVAPFHNVRVRDRPVKKAAISLPVETKPVDSENVLLSFPHSGNHLTRFLIELLTGLPTHGCKGNPDDMPVHRNQYSEQLPFDISNPGHFIYHKYHRLPLNPIADLIVLLRDPREVLLSVNNFSLTDMHLFPFSRYWGIVDYYLRYGGRKRMFFYADMMTEPAQYIRTLATFIPNCRPDMLQRLTSSPEYWYRLSITAGGRAWAKPRSMGKTQYYYSQKSRYDFGVFNRYLYRFLSLPQYAFIAQKYGIDVEGLLTP